MKVFIDNPARKFIRKLNPKEQQRILKAIFNLPNGDVLNMSGSKNKFRLRVGDWRIIFETRNDEFFILDAGNRGDIYK